MDFEKTEINWPSICRICLQTSTSDMKCIFDEPSKNDDVVAKIIKCGGVPVEIMDGLPDLICEDCLVQLNLAFTFRNTCQESYYHLLSFLKTKEQDKNIKDEEISMTGYIKIEDFYPEDVTTETLNNDSNDNAEIQHLANEILVEPLSNLTKQPKRIRSRKRKNSETDQMPKPRGRRPNPNPETKFICHICGNVYSKQSRLSQHIKSHEEKEHECEICGKKFASAAQIPRHMNTHTGNRPYQCKYCSASFGDTSTRNKHERIHTNERPYKCLECGKAFSYSNVLKVHMTIHTGERPFSCSVCGKRFSQKHHQQSHERTHSNFNGRNMKL